MIKYESIAQRCDFYQILLNILYNFYMFYTSRQAFYMHVQDHCYYEYLHRYRGITNRLTTD